jgi:DNA-binding XRE family transcriptional regulator
MLESLSQEIRESIIRDWLLGVPRDTIAQSAGVAEGTVTNIVEFYKQNENSVDLQRQIAVVIRKTGTDVYQFASNLRWQNALSRAGSSNEKLTQFISALQKECDFNGINVAHAISTLVQIAEITATQKIPLVHLSSHIEKEYAEAERIELDLEFNREILELSNEGVEDALVRNRLTLEKITKFLSVKKTLRLNGLLIGDLTSTVRVISNVKSMGYDPSLVVSKLSEIESLERRKAKLEKECDNYEANLEQYAIKLKAAQTYWGNHEASVDLYANAVSMGLTPHDIFDAVTIFAKNVDFTPQQVIHDLRVYGDIRAAIFKSKRELNKLNPERNTFII